MSRYPYVAARVQGQLRPVDELRDIGAASLTPWLRHTKCVPVKAYCDFRMQLGGPQGVGGKEDGDKGFSLLFMDLDDFKAINDEHGHPVGDKALRFLACVVGENPRAWTP